MWGRRRRKQGAGRTRLRRLLAGARAERTANIISIVVTLDVSKLSGWLNAIAYCRVEREAWEEGREAGRAGGLRACGGGGGTSSALGGPDCGGCAGRGTRDERTLNMPFMFVTRDVSKLSGWLNASVNCRVEREA